MSRSATTMRVAWADLPTELRERLEQVARGQAVDGYHGYRAGPWLKLIGVLLGAAATTGAVVLAGRFWGLSNSRPLDPVAVNALAVAASLGALLALRNLRRLLVDPPLERWAFVTPSLMVRVEVGGKSALVDRLADFTPSQPGPGRIEARQLQGDVSYDVNGGKLRIKGFESLDALADFSAAIAAGVAHVRSRPDDSEDAWLAAVDPARAPPRPGRLGVGLILLLLSAAVGAGAVALARRADLSRVEPPASSSSANSAPSAAG